MPRVGRGDSTASLKSQQSKTSLRKQDTLILKKQASTASVTKQQSTPGRKQSSVKLSSAQTGGKQDSVRKTTSLKKKASTATTSNSVQLQKNTSKPQLLKKSSENGRGKRKKVKATRYEPKPDTANKRQGRKKAAKKERSDKVILFPKGRFVAIRSDEADEPFYIARTRQVVRFDTDFVQIHWLTTREQPSGIYVWNFPEKIQTECLVCSVLLRTVGKDTYELPADQKRKIEAEIQRGIDKAANRDADDSGISADEGETRKTRKTPKKSSEKKQLKRKGSKKAPLKRTTSTKAKKQSARGQKSAEKKAKDEEKRKLKEALKQEKLLLKTNPNALLKARPNIKVLEKDPFVGSRDKVPFISTSVQSKLIHRAIRLGDNKLLQQLVDDTQQVAKVNLPYSLSDGRDPAKLALEKEDLKAIKIIFKEMFDRDSKKASRVSMPQSLLSHSGTGQYNHRSLGVPNIRPIAMSRGSREGNNAFTKDLNSGSRYPNIKDYIKHALQTGVKKSTLDAMLVAADKSNEKHVVHDNIYLAVRHGHRKLAGELMKEREFQFNRLHIDSLLLDNEEMKGPIRIPSVRKKPFDNHKITPIHCAAINPNTKHMAKLLQIVPEYGILDEKLRRPIHYAAACEGPGPLEFLLKRGQDPAECDGMGMTPLMIACDLGRLANVKVLMEKGEQDKRDQESRDEEADEEEEFAVDNAIAKYGVGGVNRPVAKPQNTYCSYTPFLLAVLQGHVEVVEELLKHGADTKKILSPSKDKLTAMMIACRKGNLRICRLLFKHECPAEEFDTKKRTPLMHAVICGHAHIVSYLLNIGVDVNRADSSGSTAMHYAAAYGWYHCLRLLLEAGADPNVSNDWKTTPLGIAFMKGHTGLADILLEQPGVDINFTDEKGMTLTALACSSDLDDSLVKQIDYLVNKKKADCKKMDINQNSALHHLASNSIPKNSPDAMDASIKIANILIKNGCDPSAKNEIGITPVMAAAQSCNTRLLEHLLSKGGSVVDCVNQQGQNILHVMADQCVHRDMHSLLTTVRKSAGKADISKMVEAVDNLGFTPLLRACHAYRNWNGSVVVQETSSNQNTRDQQEDEEEEEEEEDEEGVNDDEYMSDINDDEEAMDDVEEDEMDVDEDEDEEAVDDDDQEDGSKDAETPRLDELEEEDDTEDSEAADPTYKPETSLTPREQQQRKQWKDAREFIECLIKQCGANINTPVAKKKCAPGVKQSTDEAHHYADQVGKFTPVHFLIHVGSELSVSLGNSHLEPRPALEMLLRYRPDIDVMSFYGRTPLLSSIAIHSHRAIHLLLEAGANVHISSQHKDDKGATPFLMAAKLSNDDVMKALISRKANVNVYDTEMDRKCAIHYIVSHNRPASIKLKQLKMLMDAGAEIDAKTGLGRTALHLAVSENRGSTDVSAEIEQFLLESGADIFAKDDDQKMPLHYVFCKADKHNDRSSTDPIELCSTLTQAMQWRQIDEADDWGRTPLHAAALRGAGVCCMHLLQKGADIGKKDNCGNSPLALAISGNHESCTIMLLQKSADISVSLTTAPVSRTETKEKPSWQWAPLRKPEERTESVSTPILQEVIKKEWQGVMYMMLDLFDQCGVQHAEAVEAALNTGKYHLAMTFIRKAKNNKSLQTLNKKKQNLFHILANQADFNSHLQDRVMNELLERGVAMDTVDEYKCTPLHYACLHLNENLARFLCEKGQDTSAQVTDKYGRTPVAALFWSRSTRCNVIRDMVSVLKRYGGRLDFLCDFPYSDVQLFGHKLTSRSPDYHETPASTRPMISPLIQAIRNQDFDLTRNLIESGASLNFPDQVNCTPIMHAVMMNDLHMVKLLLNNSYRIPSERDCKEEIKPSSTAIRRGYPRKISPKKVEQAGSKRAASKSRAFALARSMHAKKQRVEVDSDQESEEEEYSEEEEEIVDENMAAEVENLSNDIDLNYPAFEKTSNVNLNAKDSQGWSVLHHLVQPLKYQAPGKPSVHYGSWDNPEMLHLLVSAGASLNRTNNRGRQPLDDAITAGAPRLTKAMQKLAGISRDSWIHPEIRVPSVDDGLGLCVSTPDFQADSQALVEEFERECAAEEGRQAEVKPTPDPKLEMDDSGEVLKDNNIEEFYDVLLTKIDVKQGWWGMYNYYKMQVVLQKGRDIYVLFTRWGRIGDPGQFQRTPFPTKEEAAKEFCKIFKAKTGNDWKNLKTFENKPKKYRLVHLEQRKSNKKLKSLKLDLKSDIPSQLPEQVKHLLYELTDTDMMANTMRRMGMAENLMPFGRIKKDILLKALGVLKNIKTLVTDIKDMDSNAPDYFDEYHKKLEEISSLSSEYFHLIPRDGYAYERIEPLYKEDSVQKEWKHIETLLEIERASKIMAGAQYRVKDENPMDYVYRSLQCQMNLLDENSAEAQYLLRYVRASFRGRVEGIFAVSRAGEAERLRDTKLNNHMLLFHGSSTANLISILSRGLLIAPAEAPTTGYAFGKGIYTADMFTKSMCYCYNRSTYSKNKFMLVCQVALGNVHDFYQCHYMEKPTTNYHSTKGYGSREPDPKYDVVLPEGAVIPLGETRNAPYPEKFQVDKKPYHHLLSHNEYILYREEQVCLRYIIQFQS